MNTIEMSKMNASDFIRALHDAVSSEPQSIGTVKLACWYWLHAQPLSREALDAMAAMSEEIASTQEAELPPELQDIVDTQLVNSKGPADIPFGPHLTCVVCQGRCADHVECKGTGNIWCVPCAEAWRADYDAYLDHGIEMPARWQRRAEQALEATGEA